MPNRRSQFWEKVMECKQFIKSLADPFHCKACRRSLEAHDQVVAVHSPFDFITVVLDRSGSMQAVKEKTIAGFNSYLADQRLAGEELFTMVQFDDVYEVLYDAVPIASVELRTSVNYRPRGSTALLDAMGRAIATTAEKVEQLPTPLRSVLVSVITDGAENSSKEFCGKKGARRIFAMIEEHRKQGWQFFFIGAEPDAIETAVQYGFARSHAATYAADAPDEAFGRLSRSNVKARGGDGSGCR